MLARRIQPVVAAAARRYVSTSGVDSRVCAVLGGQWGDEGKGKLADVLASRYDLVARFNGGANAGHTVVVGDKKYAFHLLPCGLIHPHTKNLLGNGVVVDFDALDEESRPLTADGIEWFSRLFISDRAHLLCNYHKVIDGIQERRRAEGGSAIGTTQKGIGPCYTTKAMRSSALRVGDLRDWSTFEPRLCRTIDELQRIYDFEYDMMAELERLEYQADCYRSRIVDGVHMINEAYAANKKILAEGANAVMLDLDFGTFPYVTSSSTGAGGVCTGLGLAPNKVDTCIGVIKAYTTRVGGGPFPTELTDERGGGDRPSNAPGSDIGLHLQTVGAEIGVTTGRKRRCGWLDAVVMQYSTLVNGYSSINITKLDVLDDLDEIRIGVAYNLNGQILPPGMMPASLEELAEVEVEYETLPGWKTSISGCSSFDELPLNAQKYIRRVEELAGCPVSWVGTGPKRTDMLQLIEN